MQSRVKLPLAIVLWAAVQLLRPGAYASTDSGLPDFELDDGKGADADDDYYYVSDGSDQQMQPSHKIISYAKPPDANTPPADAPEPFLMEDDDTSFEVMDDVDFVEHGPSLDFRQKAERMKRIMLAAFANREFQRKFGEVLPLLKVLSKAQKSTLAALITAQVNSREGHTLSLEQCALAFVLVLGAVVGALAQTPAVLRDTTWGEFPSVVLVKTPREDQYCLGAVINANHILTSAFCVLTYDRTRVFPARLVRVFGGDVRVAPVSPTRQTRTASHIFVHEDYRPHTFEHNIAVIRLAEPFDLPSNTIEPAQIRTRIVPDGHACDAVTWYRPVVGGQQSQDVPRQQTFGAYIRNRDVCAGERRTELTIQESSLCAYTTLPSVNLVQGDPLFCDGELASIQSYTYLPTGQQPQPQPNLISTQVRFYSHWINSQLTRTQPMPEGWNPSVLSLILVLGAVAGGLAQTENVIRNAVRGEFPSVVFVTTPRHLRCVGTVINANHVLASAFCVMTDNHASIYPARLVRVIGGVLNAVDQDATRQVRYGQHIFVHENFRVRSHDHLLAVIRLDEPLHLPSNGIEEAHIRMRIVPQGHQCDVVRISAGTAAVVQAYNVDIRNRNSCETCCIQYTRAESNICTEALTIPDNIIRGDPMFCDGELVALGATIVTTGQTRRFHLTQLIVLIAAVTGSMAQSETVVRNPVRGEFPSVVFVATSRNQQCVGTVINANHVLTSAFCVMTDNRASIYPARLVRIIGGVSGPSVLEVTRQVRHGERIFVHEDYRVHSSDNNLAMIRLSEPFHLPSNGIEEAHVRMRLVPEGYPCDVVRILASNNVQMEVYGVTIRNRNLCDACCTTSTRAESNICTEAVTIAQDPIPGDALFCDGELTAIAATTHMQGQTNRLHLTQLNFAAPRIGISAVYVHPQYNPFTFEHNLAVLRTSSNFFFPVTPVPNLDAALFYEEVPFDGQACQAAGWNNATATPAQQFINTPILNRDTCNGLAVHLGNIRESMVCAGGTNAGPGVCASNLGTGLFCEGRLAGILSTGLGCGQANTPGVYAQIRFYLPWIREQFARQDIPVGGTSPIPNRTCVKIGGLFASPQLMPNESVPTSARSQYRPVPAFPWHGAALFEAPVLPAHRWLSNTRPECIVAWLHVSRSFTTSGRKRCSTLTGAVTAFVDAPQPANWHVTPFGTIRRVRFARLIVFEGNTNGWSSRSTATSCSSVRMLNCGWTKMCDTRRV
uniref:Peptidase S1 domain-containing protein n=1 Tax=Anopheles dirus TaxID=7168 RepID=A0A182NJ05_9DIPT